MSRLSLALNDLLDSGYKGKEIEKGLNDIHIRLSWIVDSICSIHSLENQNIWFRGKIMVITDHVETIEKKVLVQYNGTCYKTVKMFDKNIKPFKFKYGKNHHQILKLLLSKLHIKNMQNQLKTTNVKKNKKKSKKKKKKFYSGLGIDNHSITPKYWQTINISMTKLVLFGFTHQNEQKHNIFIPNDITELIIKFFYHNKYIAIEYRKQITQKQIWGQRINKLEIEKNSLFKFYETKCPKCKKVKHNNNQILLYIWSERGKYSNNNNYRNNANIYQCKYCDSFVIINVKDYYFYINLRIRALGNYKYKCYVTPFGNLLGNYSISKLEKMYTKKGECHECNFGTIQLKEERGYDGFINKQTRYCVYCGLYHEEILVERY
eukprot:478142_1